MSVLEKSLVRIFRVCCLLFSYQCSFLLLPFHATAFILYQSISCLSTTFLFFLLLWSNPSRDSLFRIAYSPRLVNSFLISFCNLLFSKFSSEYFHTHARIFMQNFLFFIRSASACHSLVSVSTSERMLSYHAFPELSMLFLYFAQFRIFWHQFSHPYSQTDFMLAWKDGWLYGWDEHHSMSKIAAQQRQVPQARFCEWRGWTSLILLQYIYG